MSGAIYLERHGGPDVLQWRAQSMAEPGAGEVRVRHTAIGVNFSDIGLRTGTMPAKLPSGIGFEAAGIVEAVGKGVRDLKRGSRVAYSWRVPGAYATDRVVPAQVLTKLPAALDDETIAGAFLKGLTAQILVRRAFPVARGHTVLLHAAAGGVGLILAQWARQLGARVIGVVSTEEKARLAKRNGCWRTLIGSEDLALRVKSLTTGAGVDAVYDSVGKDVFLASLDCMKPRGTIVCYGQSSGPAPALTPMDLGRRGSLYLHRMMGGDYLSVPAESAASTRELLSMLSRRRIRVHIGRRYALDAAAQAQADVEQRRTVGSTVLIP
ncbi:MAG TPA: quinone oxidoreductase [Steroidobacteraceae bacterium]|nr:quinone oxidoreductase [Steroidobacteraceae bacterium]